ncbi:MAG: helix-turn-helix domain-containing protein [Flavobacteriales bacterium]|nr:helix-turn-helix domain-containing protein [Flavobacteriales bacterium]
MKEHAIPVHHLRSRIPTRVEHIAPAKTAVNNGVHRHDFHELFFFANGSGEHMIDLEQITVKAPCMHVVAPGQVHQLQRSADMQGLVVMFGTDAHLGQGHAARAELFAHADGSRAFALDSAQLREAQALVQQMQAEIDRSEGPVAEIVEGYLGILLIKCAHWAREGRTAPAAQEGTNDVVRRFIELVERGYITERQVHHYAGQLAVSADHLNELVKARLDCTASKVIQDRLFLEAKRLLLHAEMSIKEVGYALNMSDPAYFTRWFSKMDGRTPADYRTHIRDLYKG